MVVSDSHPAAGAVGPTAHSRTPAEVVWHDLECGGYRADLPLWRELAERADGGAILDVGAGTGRVAVDLARAGHEVVALDLDATLLGALRRRAAGLRVEIACADARTFELRRHDFALCLAPMQTVHLLGGARGRLAFLRQAHAHLRRGAVIACALLSALEPFDSAAGGEGPAAERAHVDGLLYVSRATRVSEAADSVTIERERRIVSDRPGHALTTAPPVERNVILLDRLDARTLEAEAIDVGLRPLPRREVPATSEYVGSTVVMLGV